MGKQLFNYPIDEVIRRRRSVRNYKPAQLEDEVKNRVAEYMNTLKGPFEAPIQFQMVEQSSFTRESNSRIGTYGFIKGATTYIVAITQQQEKSLVQLGYMLEETILYATSLGLGTCWLGGTFNRGFLTKHLGLSEKEYIPIVTPIGYPMEKSLMEKAIRFTAGSDNRKSWEELFFDGSFSKSLGKAGAGSYALALEMVRLAPSASNKQPWRVVKTEKHWHFYLRASKGYGKALGFNIQEVDMGIAMCHFEKTLQEQGINGGWVINNSQVEKIETDLDTNYLASWVEA